MQKPLPRLEDEDLYTVGATLVAIRNSGVFRGQVTEVTLLSERPYSF
ncbi:MAG: hypothetical protein SVY53_14715 [Chloroflexota bacterium]|nr:hypothetical protein [Chloroflexota bacterium]